MLAVPTLPEIRAARDRIAGVAERTPVVPLAEPPNGAIWCKLENLQPIGSFKIRGAANAMLSAVPDTVARGVYTASAGNMAQGVAWCARVLGVRCQVVVPEHAPRVKIEAIERLGGEVIRVSFERWWQTMMEHRFDGLDGLFVHPVADQAVITGNGTIGLEIAEQIPDVDVVLVPFGGGGLSCGIAAAIKALRPGVRVYACEVATATPFTASIAAGRATMIERTPSFVDGIGGRGVLEEMWPLASTLLDGAFVVTVEQIAEAVRHLAAKNHLIAEGAGAAPVAVAFRQAGAARLNGRMACVISGGNIESTALATILGGGVP
jgi:threonine dehydratase